MVDLASSLQHVLPLLTAIIGTVAAVAGSAIVLFIGRRAASKSTAAANSYLSDIRLETDDLFKKIETELDKINSTTGQSKSGLLSAQEIIESYRLVQSYNRELLTLFRRSEDLRNSLGLEKDDKFLDDVTQRTARMNAKIDKSVEFIEQNYQGKKS